MTKDEATASPKDAALKLALDLAIMHHSDDGYAELRSKVRQLAKEALAPTSTQCEVQPEQEPWCMKMNGCKTKCEDCPDEAAQPEQEPIAIAECKVVHGHMCQFLKRTRHGMDTLKDGDKLYTTPPKRPWAGLTDEFCITNMFDMGHYSLQIVFKSRKNADEFKAALKEKNT